MEGGGREGSGSVTKAMQLPINIAESYKAWPMCLCAVPSELKGEGRNPAPLLHGPLCPEEEMLELTEQRRLGSGRGGSSSHSCLCLSASHRSAVQPEPGWSTASSRL